MISPHSTHTGRKTHEATAPDRDCSRKGAVRRDGAAEGGWAAREAILREGEYASILALGGGESEKWVRLGEVGEAVALTWAQVRYRIEA